MKQTHAMDWAPPLSAGGRVVPALVAMALGLAVVFAAGLAQNPLLHEAAHDSRHTLSLPCH